MIIVVHRLLVRIHRLLTGAELVFVLLFVLLLLLVLLLLFVLVFELLLLLLIVIGPLADW